MIRSPNVTFVPEYGFSVFSVIVNGMKSQDFSLKVINNSLAHANCKFMTPLDGFPNDTFFQFSALPAKVSLSPQEMQVFHIRIKVDPKKYNKKKPGMFAVKKQYEPKGPNLKPDLLIHGIFGIKLLDCDLLVPIPYRILYKDIVMSLDDLI